MKQGQAGLSAIKLMVIITLLWVFGTVAGRIVPGVYDFFLLRDLADRVVGEYAALKMDAVNKRVQFELRRTRITVDDQTFVIIRSDRGYRVYVDYPISLEFDLPGYNLSVEGYEYFSLTYEAES